MNSINKINLVVLVVALWWCTVQLAESSLAKTELDDPESDEIIPFESTLIGSPKLDEQKLLRQMLRIGQKRIGCPGQEFLNNVETSFVSIESVPKRRISRAERCMNFCKSKNRFSDSDHIRVDIEGKLYCCCVEDNPTKSRL